MSAPRRAAIAALLFPALLAAPVSGQSFWITPAPTEGVTLEAVRPNLMGYSLTVPSMAYYFTFRYGVVRNLQLKAEVPFANAHFDIERAGDDGGGTALGNVYLGAVWATPDSRYSVELGGRVPTTDEQKFARVVGIWGDIDRMDAYYPDMVSIDGRVNVLYPLPDGRFALRAGVGTGWWRETAGDRDSEITLGYGGQLWYRGDYVDGVVGASGFAFMTDDADWSDRSWHQVGFGASWANGPVRPGVHLRLPIGANMEEVVGYVLGLHVSVPTHQR